MSPRDDASGYGLGLFIEHDSRFGPIASHAADLLGAELQGLPPGRDLVVRHHQPVLA